MCKKSELIDEMDAKRYPGLYLIITGTPMFFDGPQGIQRLEPLAQRLHTDFSTDATQIRLTGFDLEMLTQLGCQIRDIYVMYAKSQERLTKHADDSYIKTLASSIAGKLGGKIGIAPRLFLKKLISDILDRIDQFPDFDPRKDYSLTLNNSEMNKVERNALSAKSVDDISIDL